MIVFIGRQNTGKSTLFNRLAGSKKAVVSAVAGTTLDRIKALITWQGKEILICDIAGLPIDKNNPLSEKMNEQALIAISEASEIMLTIDGKTGIVQDDIVLIDWLRKQNKKFSVIVNKIDNLKQISPTLTKQVEKYCFDSKRIFYLSALHGKNINELLDYLSKFAQKVNQKKEYKIVIAGRQNTGKSTLFNTILQQKRSIVSGIAGTTRDSIEELFTKNKMNFKIIDTAGIRKKSKIYEAIEKQSVSAALQSIDKADGVICLIDAQEGPTQQDIKIIDYTRKSKKQLIIAVNKWDLTGLEENDAIDMILSRFSFLKLNTIIPICAETGWNVKPLISQMQQQLSKRGL